MDCTRKVRRRTQSATLKRAPVRGEVISASLADLAASINGAHRECEKSVHDTIRHALHAGDLLIEAKRQIGHGGFGKWLAENFDGSERTAQTYMRIARSRAAIEGNPQRAADLTVRAATAQIAKVARFTRVAKQAEETRSACIQAGTPTLQGRQLYILRNEAEKKWCVILRKNAVGAQLPELLDKARSKPDHAALLQDAKDREARAVKLADEAELLKRQAANIRRTVDAAIIDDIRDEHGEPKPFSETFDFAIDSPALDDHLKTLSREQLAQYLLDNRCGDGVREIERGYWGDLRLTGYQQFIPSIGAWTRTGCDSWIEEYFVRPLERQ